MFVCKSVYIISYIVYVQDKATSATVQISHLYAKVGKLVTFNCTTNSTPKPRQRLYRQRAGSSVSVVHTVTDVTLSWTVVVEAADNKAEFYCRADDNSNIEGWQFDVKSETQELIVWCRLVVIGFTVYFYSE